MKLKEEIDKAKKRAKELKKIDRQRELEQSAEKESQIKDLNASWNDTSNIKTKSEQKKSLSPPKEPSPARIKKVDVSVKSSGKEEPSNGKARPQSASVPKKKKAGDPISLLSSKNNENINYVNQLQQSVPGNSELDHSEFMKLGVRQNRYGLFGDNEFQQAIEIKKRPLPVTVEKSSKDHNSLQLSKEGVLSVLQQVKEYNDKKMEE